jgi:hypothetical protein
MEKQKIIGITSKITDGYTQKWLAKKTRDAIEEEEGEEENSNQTFAS